MTLALALAVLPSALLTLIVYVVVLVGETALDPLTSAAPKFDDATLAAQVEIQLRLALSQALMVAGSAASEAESVLTVRMSWHVLPALSVAVTVMTFRPDLIETCALQAVVPLHVPLPLRSLAQATLVTHSEAVPAMFKVETPAQ